MASIEEENENFTLSDNINGPLLATTVLVELVISFITNLFIFVFTLCHPKILKHPSIIFLTNFVVINLVINIAYMPSIIVSATAGKWIFGGDLQEKTSSCQFIGFIYMETVLLITFTLTAISVDRFLFIVKPLLYKRLMKIWVAVTIVVLAWMLSCMLCLPLLFGIGRYSYSEYITTCIPYLTDTRGFVILLYGILFLCVAVIVFTTLWTFCFTRKFLKTFNSSHNNGQDHVYNKRLKKVIGLFGALLTVTIVTYIPAVLAVVVKIVVNFDKTPGGYLLIINQFYILNTISNPIIQSRFRKELSDYLTLQYKKIQNICSCCKRTRVSSNDDTQITNSTTNTSNSEQVV